MAETNQYEPMLVGENNLRDSLIVNPKTLAEKILKKEAVTCSITLPVQEHDSTTGSTSYVTTTIPFYMENDFSLGTFSSDWKDLYSMEQNMFNDLVNYKAMWDGEAQISLQSYGMTNKVWRGSTFGGFSIPCLFVSTRRTLNPTNLVKQLLSTVLPSRLSSGQASDPSTAQVVANSKEVLNTVIDGSADFANYVGSGISSVSDNFDTATWQDNVSKAAESAKNFVDEIGLVAPLRYGLKTISGSTSLQPLDGTTCTLQIGNYFRASELLMAKVSGISFSKEIIAPISSLNGRKSGDVYDNSAIGTDSGYPLYAKCMLELIPTAMVHLEKLNSYFMTSNPSTTTSTTASTSSDSTSLPT